MLTVRSTQLPEVLLLEPMVLVDERGYFLESWNRKIFRDATGLNLDFVQDNHARSVQGVLRGLHYQICQPQGKLVRVVSGRIFDVTVDMRRSSPRLGQWTGMELVSDNHQLLWIPPGFAHGFLALSEEADVLYKTTDYYAPQNEYALAWNDTNVGIDWPLADKAPLLSTRDAAALPWADCPLFD